MTEGRYTLLSRLGSGGAGEVWRSRFEGPQGFQKEVAIKILRDRVEDGAALRREADLLGAIRHRAVVRVDGLTQVQDQWALVMELVEGVGLAQLARQGRVPSTAALSIVAEVASALHAAWTTPGADGRPLRILHRDIKPDNIMLTRLGEPRLLDFGIASQQQGSDPHGTPAYMAPERLNGQPGGPEADVYSAGVVLFELLSARPFGRSSPRVAAHDRRVRAALSSLEGVDPQVTVLLAECLAFEPNKRPGHRDLARRAEGLAAALEGPSLTVWAEQAVPLVDGGAPATGAEQTLAWTSAAPSNPEQGRRGVAWGRWLAAPVGGLVLGLGIWLGGRPDPNVELPPPVLAPSEPAVAEASPSAEEIPAPSAPAPRPKITPPATRPAPPEALPPPPSIEVRLEGEATAVSLAAKGATFPVPGAAPPGRYEVRATFPALGEMGAGSVEIPAHGPVTLRCGGRLTLCAVVQP